MTDKKLTDEEIIKNYEWCIGCTSDRCRECTMDEQGFCEEELQDLALDLINRQKAEIERLNKKVEELSDVLSGTIRIRYAKAKSEAYKEFAEKIKMSIKANVVETLCNDAKGAYNAEYVLDDIDNLLKEMVGEEE